MIANKGLQIDAYHSGLNYIAGLSYMSLKDMVNAKEHLGWAARSSAYRSQANALLAQIQLIDQHQKTLAEKPGLFDDRDKIYQQLFPLPCINNLYVQVCTFTAQGNYAGSGVRVDPTMIIGKESDCLALQVCHK